MDKPKSARGDQLIPDEDSGLVKKIYSGTSMYPTLKAGDVLYVDPCRPESIRRGDLIVFRSPDRSGLVVHRVLRRHSESYRTMGDNGAGMDRLACPFKAVIGRVTGLRRKERLRNVPGGMIGAAIGRIMRSRGRSARWLARVAQPAYRRLAEVGIVRILLPGRMRLRIVSFAKPQGTEFQLFIGKNRIGRVPAGLDRWTIKRPFRLIIEEDELPLPEPKHPNSLNVSVKRNGS